MICPRCLKIDPPEVHTCTPTDSVRGLERQIAECELGRDELVAALRDIISPIAAWQRDLEDGCKLDGAMAVAMERNPETYKRMAKAALAKLGADKGEGS